MLNVKCIIRSLIFMTKLYLKSLVNTNCNKYKIKRIPKHQHITSNYYRKSISKLTFDFVYRQKRCPLVCYSLDCLLYILTCTIHSISLIRKLTILEMSIIYPGLHPISITCVLRRLLISRTYACLGCTSLAYNGETSDCRSHLSSFLWHSSCNCGDVLCAIGVKSWASLLGIRTKTISFSHTHITLKFNVLYN